MVVSHALITVWVFSMILFFTHKFLVFELVLRAFKKTVSFSKVPYAIIIKKKSALTTKTWCVAYNGFLSEFRRQGIAAKIFFHFLAFFSEKEREQRNQNSCLNRLRKHQ